MAFDPNNRMIYVSTGNGSQSAIDVISDSNNTIVATIPFPEKNPSVMVFDGSYSHLYVYDSSKGDLVYIINPAINKIVGSISTGTTGVIGDAVFDPLNQDLYIAGGTTNSVIVISTTSNKVVQTVSLQGNPSFVAFAPTTGYIYVETQNMVGGSQFTNTVTIINPLTTIPALPNTIVSTLELPASGAGICYDSRTGNIYALRSSPATIDVIGSQTNSITYTVGLPSNISLGARSNTVYDQVSQSLFMITGNNIVAEFNPKTNSIGGLELPSQSGAIMIDTANGNVYATLPATSEVIEFSP